MLNKILTYLSAKIATSNYFDKIFPLAEIITDGDKTYPAHYIGKGQYESVNNFDHYNGMAYFRLTGSASISNDEGSSIGCDMIMQFSYPARLVVCVPKSKLSCDDAFADQTVANTISSLISGEGGTIKKDLKASFISFIPSAFETDNRKIISEEYSANLLQDINYKFSYLAIDFTILVKIKLSCIEPECELTGVFIPPAGEQCYFKNCKELKDYIDEHSGGGGLSCSDLAQCQIIIDMQEQIDGLTTPPDASTTVKGLTKLSVAPISATNPIAVGDNDPRNTNARIPTSHAASHTNGTDDIQSATSLLKGLLTAADWTAFNAKLSTIAGISAGGDLSGTYPNPAILNSAILAKLLTGLNVAGGSILATDNLLDAFGKLQNQINGVLGGAIFQTTWNATTNSPALASGIGTKGFYYVVSVAGTTNLDGITDWEVGDWAIFDGSVWRKVDNTDAVSSVNGAIGAVNLTSADISEVTNLYFTAARVLATVITGFTSGAGTVAATDTILQAINKIVGNIALKLTANSPITGATKTKITYDANGLVTAGADATTADIADSLNKRYLTDAQQTVIGNTSGTNSGNETASTIGTLINGSTAATPNDTDLVATAESSVLKKITWTNVKAFLKTYFDTLYKSATATSQKVFHQSGVAVATTNTTGEEILRSILIPAGTLGNNDCIEVMALFDLSGRAGTLNARIRLHTSAAAAGTIYYTSNNMATTVGAARIIQHIAELNANNSQASPGYITVGYTGGVASVALATSSLSTASDMYILITSQKSTGADPSSLIFSQVKITTP